MSLEVNLKHVTMTELNMAPVDTSDKIVRNLIWLLLDTSLLAAGVNLNVPTQSAGRIHRIIKLGPTIDDDDDVGSGDGDDPPPLERKLRWKASTRITRTR